MSRLLLPDSAPLGLVSHPSRTDEVVAINRWLARCIRAGHQVLVPAIIEYELRRELLRARKVAGLARLDAFIQAAPGRYLPLTSVALRLAAELWAQARQQGRPTAQNAALDVDVILAAQALSLGYPPEMVTVATTNRQHLAQFVDARLWTEIEPA